MTQVLLIEDEEPASNRLRKLITRLAPDFEIMATIDSVKSAVDWLTSNRQPDLIFLDIQLADGLSFDIFKKVNMASFVIFTTAYDEYAIKAFELNSIDYLLKPVNEAKLKNSIDKYRRLRQSQPAFDINSIIASITSKETSYKKRFLINMGSKIKSIETHDIALFYVLEKSTFLTTTDGKDYPVDFSLDKLETLLDRDQFFRINRQAMVNYNAIKNIAVFSKSRIRIEIQPTSEIELLVSTHKSHLFREWLDR